MSGKNGRKAHAQAEAPTATAVADPPPKHPEANGVHANGTPPQDAPRHPVMKFGPYAIDKGSNLSVAVWDKVIKMNDGREFTVYTTSLQCSYYDEQAGEWKETKYWRGAALPILIHALNQAYSWILEARNEAKAPF